MGFEHYYESLLNSGCSYADDLDIDWHLKIFAPCGILAFTYYTGVDWMAKERDYRKEWELEKKRGVKLVGTKISDKLKDDFEHKCEANGTTKMPF